MTTLNELIQKIQYDSSWGIWAEAPFTRDSVARYGQSQFENGGLLDDKVFFADGVRCGDFIAEYTNGDEDFKEEAAEMLIDEVERERQDSKD